MIFNKSDEREALSYADCGRSYDEFEFTDGNDSADDYDYCDDRSDSKIIRPKKKQIGTQVTQKTSQIRADFKRDPQLTSKEIADVCCINLPIP